MATDSTLLPGQVILDHPQQPSQQNFYTTRKAYDEVYHALGWVVSAQNVNGVITVFNPQARIADLAGMAPIRTIRMGTDLSIGTVAFGWHDTDDIGSNTARSLDLVIPNVLPGQWISAKISAISVSVATAVLLDFWTVVAGVAVHQFGAATTGQAGLSLFSSENGAIEGGGVYQVQASDIENGAVRVRLRDRNTTATARKLFGTSGYQVELTADGPFWVRPTTHVVFDGQSLNMIPFTGLDPYPAQLMLNRLYPWSCVSIAGTSWSGLAATAATRRDPVLNHTGRCILVMNGGTSDFLNDHDSAATALADAEAYADAARAACKGDLRIIVCTIPPSTVVTGSDDTHRITYNGLLLNSTHFDAFVDLAAVPVLANPLDTTYYVDGLHWTAAGALAAAVASRTALEAMLLQLA